MPAPSLLHGWRLNEAERQGELDGGLYRVHATGGDPAQVAQRRPPQYTPWVKGTAADSCRPDPTETASIAVCRWNGGCLTCRCVGSFLDMCWGSELCSTPLTARRGDSSWEVNLRGNGGHCLYGPINRVLHWPRKAQTCPKLTQVGCCDVSGM